MKLKLIHLDRYIIFLMGFLVLVDMLNGFFIIYLEKIPISQIFKFLLLSLIFLRLCFTKDIITCLAIVLIFLVGPVNGYLKTHSFPNLYEDVVVASKWASGPIAFFYFKNIFQSKYIDKTYPFLKKMISRSFYFLTLNMLLGALGFGMAFYNHGYGNAVGTKGFIYAGNELTILLLAIGFSIACYLYAKKKYGRFTLCFIISMLFAFLITSKTVMGGVFVIFLIPIFSEITSRLSGRTIKNILYGILFFVPILVVAAVIGIRNSGILEKIESSMQRNDGDILTVILSNRNNFVESGWDVFWNEYSVVGKLFGYGQKLHLEKSGHLAEIDFLSILFASGLLGLLAVLLLIFYWHINTKLLKNRGKYIFSSYVLWYLYFLIVAANLSGHIFGSGIASFFIGFSIALMFYKEENETTKG